MVLLQLGFLEAVKITATNNFEQVDFDIVLVSPRYEQFYAAGFFPLDRLTQAREVAAVVGAAPMYATFNLWRCPAYPVSQSESNRDVEPSPGPIERWLVGRQAAPSAPAPGAVRHGDRPRQEPVSRANPRPDRGGQGSASPRAPSLAQRAVPPRFRLADPRSGPGLGAGQSGRHAGRRLPHAARFRRGFHGDLRRPELPVALQVPSRPGKLRIPQGPRRPGRGTARTS